MRVGAGEIRVRVWAGVGMRPAHGGNVKAKVKVRVAVSIGVMLGMGCPFEGRHRRKDAWIDGEEKI